MMPEAISSERFSSIALNSQVFLKLRLISSANDIFRKRDLLTALTIFLYNQPIETQSQAPVLWTQVPAQAHI